MGKVAGERGAKKVVTITWKYAAGDESVQGFKDGLKGSGGEVVKDLTLPFPNVEFQALLTEIAATKPDAVYAFFAGGGAVKFVKDYAAAGLNKTIPLYGPGFLTDGTLEAQGEAAQGLLTTLHYADGLTNAKDKAFRAGYHKAYNAEPDVYAVQGYDAAQLLGAGLAAVGGEKYARSVNVGMLDIVAALQWVRDNVARFGGDRHSRLENDRADLLPGGSGACVLAAVRRSPHVGRVCRLRIRAMVRIGP